jgi:hypothetical protein
MKTTRLLAFVALGGALLSAGFLSTAYSLATANDSRSPEIVERELPWDGASRLVVDMPATIRYVQAPGPGRLIARGPHRSVSTLTIDGGYVHDQLLHTGAVIDITLTAPDVASFSVNGASRLTIEQFDQETLDIVTEGGGRVDASGRVRAVSVRAQGSSAVNLARLDVASLFGSIGGTGALIAAPRDSADLDVRNFASVVLLTQPTQLTPRLSESGRVIDASQGR